MAHELRRRPIADALMYLVDSALAADSAHTPAEDRYMLHLVTRDHGRSVSLVDGTPLHSLDASTIACDCSTVTHNLRRSRRTSRPRAPDPGVEHRPAPGHHRP